MDNLGFKNLVEWKRYDSDGNLVHSGQSYNTTQDNFIQGIEEYLSRKKLNLVDKIRKLNIELSLEEKFPTNFSSQVLNYLLKLNYGEITSYSQIGSEIGSKAYRAIGNILKKNPLPLIIPCHRIIKKNGEYGGFMGKIEGGWQQDLKSKLLEIESHNFE